MKKEYKDVRSIRNWIKKMEESSKKDYSVPLFTLTSLTPEKISEAIREHYRDRENPNIPEWLLKKYKELPVIIRKEDADDTRLISIILYMINHIISSKYYNRKSYEEESGAVRISTENLRKLFYHNGTYIKHVVAVAQAAFILTRVREKVIPEKSEGEKAVKGQSRSYKIHLRHIVNENNVVEIVECPDPRVANKITQYQDNEDLQHSRLKGIQESKVKLYSYFYNYQLRADYGAALALLKSQRSADLNKLDKGKAITPDGTYETEEKLNQRYFSNRAALYGLSSDNIRFKILKEDKDGRLHSNLTSYPSILRKFLRFNGCDEPLAMVDMGNCQPFLLLNLIMEYFTRTSGKKIDTRKKLLKICQKNSHPDVLHYMYVVENGNFHKECYRLFRGNQRLKEITPEWKEKVRTMIYTSVYFGSGDTKWKEAVNMGTRFRREYPTVCKIIDDYRSPDYLNLSNRLHREESKLFIDDILTKLLVREQRPFILSLHDGFLVPESAVSAVIEKFEYAFAKTQFQVRLKIDHYGTGQTETVFINERKSGG